VNPRRTRIKICGIGRPEDAAAAAAAGADAIGLVFHPPAPRYVSLDRAREIMAALPAFVTPVGLFVNVDAGFIRDTAGALGLRHVQLNGDESPEFVAALAPLVAIKALRVERDTFGRTLGEWREGVKSLPLTNLKGVVLETAGTGRAGGTGVANDWETVRHHIKSGDFAGLPPVIAAGGLTPETVGAVVRDIRPWAVDVSSGVEESLGRKSVERIRSFVAAVRAADVG
jgi:phosphoribosylanthranilate isomerase